jgi:hypothetical protein
MKSNIKIIDSDKEVSLEGTLLVRCLSNSNAKNERRLGNEIRK